MKRVLVTGGILIGLATANAKSPGAAFLTLSPSVRAEGAGGAPTLAEGAEALGLNPALLTLTTSQGQISTSFARLWEDTVFAHAAGTWTVGKRHTGMGVAFSTLKTEGNEHRNDQGILTGTRSDSQDTTALAAISLRPSRPWRVGVAARLFRSDVGSTRSDTGWSSDWGAAWSTQKTVIGLSINHLGPGQKFIHQRDSLPTVVEIDGSWASAHFTGALGAAREIAAARTRLTGGAEFRWGPLAVRSGLTTRIGGKQSGSLGDSSTEEWLNGLSLGVGVLAAKRWRFDYAISQPSTQFDVVHRAGLSWSWGPAPQPFDSSVEKQKKPTQKIKGSPTRLRLFP